jgi:predicted transcriptional regulator
VSAAERLTVRVDGGTAIALRELARNTGASVAEHIRAALDDYLHDAPSEAGLAAAWDKGYIARAIGIKDAAGDPNPYRRGRA